MRHLLVIPVLALVVAGGAGADDTAQAPQLSARLTSCTTGATGPDRAAVFTGSMPAVPGTQQMAMRFDLLQRRPGSPLFRRVAAPKLGAWERSRRDPTLPGYIVTKRVDGLAAPGAYRAVVRFRWYDAHGRVARHARRVTRACRQLDQRPDLTIGDVSVARALVAAGLGIAVMGEHTIPRNDTSVTIRPLPGGNAPSRTIIATWLRGRRVPAVDHMLPLLADAAAAHIDPPRRH
jgi:hypothetical protein